MSNEVAVISPAKDQARQLADHYLDMRGVPTDDAYYDLHGIEPASPERNHELLGHTVGGSKCGIVFWNEDKTGFTGRYTSPLDGAEKCFGRKGASIPCFRSGTPSKRLWVAEGRTKDLTVSRYGHWACSGGGVDGTYNKNGFADGFPVESVKSGAIEEVVVLYDSDIATNYNIWAAILRVTDPIRALNPDVKVYVKILPPRPGDAGDWGIDDAVVELGEEWAVDFLADDTNLIPPPLDGIARLYFYLLGKICRALKVKMIPSDPQIVRDIINGCFWDPKRGKLNLMATNGHLGEFGQQDAMMAVYKTWQHPFDIFRGDHNASDKELAALSKLISKRILDHVKYHSQRSTIEMRVDMFAQAAYMEMLDESARVVYTHEPWTGGTYDLTIVEDYKEHFPEFDDVIKFVVAARFTRDRKRCYLWLHCVSDWGKGFLMSLFEKLDAAVEMSVEEVESTFEGNPVGKQMTDFKRHLVLVIDEMKTAKKELKQLQNYLKLAPKYQLTQTVELFAKFFMSAETIPSLAGENGVEDQFANRLSLIRGAGSLTERPLFKSASSAVYFDNILNYLIEQLNPQIATYVAVGKTEAEIAAQKELDGFYEKYKIEHHYERFSISNRDAANEFLQWLKKGYNPREEAEEGTLQPEVLRAKNRSLYLTCAATVFDRYLEKCVDKSARVSIRGKRETIFKHLSYSDDGIPRTMAITTQNDVVRTKALKLLAIVEGLEPNHEE
jgi:hypothetical protein